MDLDTFAAQLDDLARTGTIVGWPQVAAALSGGPQLPPDAVLLTFDDGHDDHHRYVLPMLAERGLPGTFFILARDPSEGLTVAHRIHVLLGAACPRRSCATRCSTPWRPPTGCATCQAELDHAVDPFDDPVDDVKWVLQRDLMDVAGPVLSRMVEELVGPEAEVAAALHLDARQVRELHAAGMTLGGHTHGHRWMDWLPREESEREIGGIRRAARGARPVARLAVRLSLWGRAAGSRRAPSTGRVPGRVRGHGHQPQRPISTGSGRRRLAGTSTVTMDNDRRARERHMIDLAGIIPATVTPMLDSQRIDYAAIPPYVERLIDGGCPGPGRQRRYR